MTADARALILAGGFGTRLGPDHAHRPKALLPVRGSTTLLDIVLAQLREGGITDVTIAVHHHAEQIIDAVGDGRRHGASVSYVIEQQPLGTAGSLALLASTQLPTIVLNCDVVTDLAVGALLDAHDLAGNALTIAARHERIASAYGVLDITDAGHVRDIVEKPVTTQLVNMGMYVLDPSVIDLVARGQHTDMDELIRHAIAADLRVGAHVHDGTWVDVACPTKLQIAREAAA